MITTAGATASSVADQMSGVGDPAPARLSQRGTRRDQEVTLQQGTFDEQLDEAKRGAPDSPVPVLWPVPGPGLVPVSRDGKPSAHWRDSHHRPAAEPEPATVDPRLGNLANSGQSVGALVNAAGAIAPFLMFLSAAAGQQASTAADWEATARPEVSAVTTGGSDNPPSPPSAVSPPATLQATALASRGISALMAAANPTVSAIETHFAPTDGSQAGPLGHPFSFALSQTPDAGGGRGVGGASTTPATFDVMNALTPMENKAVTDKQTATTAMPSPRQLGALAQKINAGLAAPPDAQSQDALPLSVARGTRHDRQAAREDGAVSASPSATALVPTSALATAASPGAMISSAMSGSETAPIAQVTRAIASTLAPSRAASPIDDTQDRGIAASSQASPMRILTIQLHPAELGTLSVRLSLKGETLDITMIAGRHETAQILSGQSDALTSALHVAGYAVGGLDIKLAGRDDTSLPPPTGLPDSGHSQGGSGSSSQAGQERQSQSHNPRSDPHATSEHGPDLESVVASGGQRKPGTNTAYYI